MNRDTNFNFNYSMCTTGIQLVVYYNGAQGIYNISPLAIKNYLETPVHNFHGKWDKLSEKERISKHIEDYVHDLSFQHIVNGYKILQ